MLFSSSSTSLWISFSIWISTSGGSLGSTGAVSKLPERTVAFVRLVTTTLWMSHVPVAPFTSNSPEPATLVKIPPTVFSELASVPLLTMTRYGVSGDLELVDRGTLQRRRRHLLFGRT